LVYERSGRLLRREYPAIKKAVSYEYDAAGQRTKLTDSNGRAVRYEYNAQNQLAAIVLPDGGRIGLEGDEKSRPRRGRYPNGITGQWEYDANDRVTAITYLDGRGAVVQGWAYRYDPAGNLLEERDPKGGLTRFQHDAVGQLTETAGPRGTERYRYVNGG